MKLTLGVGVFLRLVDFVLALVLRLASVKAVGSLSKKHLAKMEDKK